MSVQDLGRVHRRYIDLSNSFKSAWTFHQFLQGLRKVFPEQAPQAYSIDFQTLYTRPKKASENLTEAAIPEVSRDLDMVEEQIIELTRTLLGADENISPRQLRQFFQRVKNFDDNILSQLIKFYLYSHSGNGWNVDRLDKADFVATKLCEEFVEGRNVFISRDQTYLREVTQGFWTALSKPEVDSRQLDEHCAEIVQLKRSLAEVESIDDLYGRQLVQSYRSFKHQLGSAFFHPRLLPPIIATNLELKNSIHELYRREEQRIVAEYQHVFELERAVPVDVKLGEELAQFRDAVERFEKQIEGSSVRLDELGRLRAKVRELIPKLTSDAAEDSGPVVVPREVREMRETPVATPPTATPEAYVESAYKILVETLDDTNPTLDPRRVALQPEVFGLGLKQREIIAYRRLFGDATCNRDLEEFLLRTAALRYRIELEVEEIKSILDDSAITRDAPAFAVARATCKVADAFLRRFEHLMELAVLVGDIVEAQSLQKLKMRLMRSYAGLWLMAHE